ncbi:hypothetical protein VPHD148_0153 [Vibrio phage D148]
MVNSQCAVLTQQRANEILMLAYEDMERYPDLRLGQAICSVSTRDDWATSWPELFHEECPVKASELFYSIVENSGKRELTGKLDMSFLNK